MVAWMLEGVTARLFGRLPRRSVEPMTCPPDALRSGKDVVTLQPGETWRGVWGIQPV